MVIDSRSLNGNIHSTRPLTTPRIGGASGRRSQRKCAFRIDTELRRRLHARQERRRRSRRHREHDLVVRRERRSCRRRNSATRHGRRTISILRSSWSKRTLAPRSRSSFTAGSTSTLLKPSRAISGRQARPPASSVWRTIAPASPAEPCGGSMFSAASSSGCTRRCRAALAFDLVADELVVAGPQQRRQREIVGRLGVRHALAVLEDPERDAAVVHLQQPALAGLQIDERELRACFGPSSPASVPIERA